MEPRLEVEALTPEMLRPPRRPLSAILRVPFRLRNLVWESLLVLTAAVAAAAYATGYGYVPVRLASPPAGSNLPIDAAALKREISRLQVQQKQLTGAFQKTTPTGLYVVIDQTQNRLYLKKDQQVLKEAVCSAGSGMILQEQGGKNRRWVFDTPRGYFKVLSKMGDPVWKKPDWAFIEEGKPIPTDPNERFDYGTLGEYALYFGNGYLIHGTLYERLLGRSVTHGCIRLGRDDLREIYKAVPIGTPIYIY